MARKTIVVCDICESDSNVAAWEVKAADGNKVKVELCGTHGQPLARLFRLDEEAPETTRPRGRRGSNRVQTMEEIASQARVNA